MVDASETAHKFLSKNRWRTKFLPKDDAGISKPAVKANQDADVNDFLKPSTERAEAQKQAAAAAFLAGAKPRIDVARAQRWPGASDLIAAGKSPGVGGLRTGTRKKGLSVSFVRTPPAIIGEGGDECEEPAVEVSRRRAQSVPLEEKGEMQTHQDDMNVGTRSFSANQEAERRGIVTRTLTSHGELSPPLQRKMEMGNINTHATPPPVPERGLGHMGLGERPRSLQRAPTGFDTRDNDPPPRPSIDSTFSYDSENASPVLSRKAPSLAPTAEEEEESNALHRTATGWSQPQADMKGDGFLQSDPSDPRSHSAQMIHKMRADEGRALHEAARQMASKRDSVSSGDSFRPGTGQSNPLHVGTPPSQFTVPLAGKTPPQLPLRDAPPPPTSPQRALEPEYDPYRSRAARGPSPARRPMPPDTNPLDTNPGRRSPSKHPEPLSTTSSLQQTPSGFGKAPFSVAHAHQLSREADPFSAVSQRSNFPSSPGYRRPEHVEQPPVPPHAHIPRQGSPPKRSPISEVPQDPRMERPRADTRSQADAALEDFSDRVQHMKGIFLLTAQLAGQIYDHTPMEWLRVAIWWFLKGRVGMENLIRARAKNGEPQPERLTQPHVDLAKSWWIVAEIFQNHPASKKYGNQHPDSRTILAREAGDLDSAEIFETYDILMSSLKMLLGSMKRHQSMPPTQALIQGQDQTIWVEYPEFAPDAQSVLSGTASRSVLVKGPGQPTSNPANLIPLGDTKTDFCYFRMFATVSLSTDDVDSDRIPLPAVISVLRPRDALKVKLVVCSQTDLINIVVGPNQDEGPTWRDVAWKSKTRGMAIKLRHGFTLSVDLTEQDFRGLWAIVDHTNKVEINLRERSDERICAKFRLRDVSYVDPANPGAFPQERVKGCKLTVFQKFERSSEGTGKRKLHRGYRLVVVTSAHNRTLSCVNHEMGTNQQPMNFQYTSDRVDNAPGMVLRFKEETPDKRIRVCTMSMFFETQNDRNHLFGTFTSMNQAQDENVFAQVPLKAFSIESADQAEGFSQSGRDVLRRLQWAEAKALNQDPEAAGLEAAPTVMSESLRIVCRHSAGVISDRMNLGPGELLVRLPIDGAAELTLLRNPQQDMAVAIDPSRTDKDVPDALAELLKTLTNASTIRRLTFNSFGDLHAFQLAVTGFRVIFDGIASTLSISRRRMVVPIYKQWTANTIRIQIVEQDNILQLVAFFEDFSHADAMNFQLRPMDKFEKTDKGGKPCVKLVDCKFPLPVEERRGEGKMGKEEGRISGWAGMKRRFVCLDQIEYPGEHDDILIAFDSTETRDRFADALPASASVGRKFTVRRKI